jgi:hypothetical protein
VHHGPVQDLHQAVVVVVVVVVAVVVEEVLDVPTTEAR